MHIHGGNLNPNTQLQGSHRAQATLAARRAEDTRKRLSGSALELDALDSTESAWMISAWGSNGRPEGDSQASQTVFSKPVMAKLGPPTAEAQADSVTMSERKKVGEMPAPNVVSYWA
jgi:hypothetical protein